MRFYNEIRQIMQLCCKSQPHKIEAQKQPCIFYNTVKVKVIRKTWLCDISTQAHPVEHHLTVSAVIPGNKRRRPTLRFICVLTLNFAVVFALHTVSQFTAERKDKK